MVKFATLTLWKETLSLGEPRASEAVSHNLTLQIVLLTPQVPVEPIQLGPDFCPVLPNQCRPF